MLARLKPLLPVALMCLVALSLFRLGVAAPTDRALLSTRMSLSMSPPSGDIVFVAIDAQSLANVGSWPWSRAIHAQMLDRLTDAGARDVFLDLDFGFPGDQAGDDAFLAALDRAGGATLLAVTVQDDLNPRSGVLVNAPLQAFADASWPALVNVRTDSDGILRNYSFGTSINGSEVPSVASQLSGVFGANDTFFQINFAIDPHQVPTYSFADVVAGVVPDSAFTGKTVIVGAYAVELRDNFTVPVHGIMPGALVQVIAAETLQMNLVPVTLGPFMMLPFLSLIVLLLQVQARKMHMLTVLRTTLICLVAIEIMAFLAYQKFAIVVPTGMLYPTILIYGIWRIGKTLDLNKLLVQIKQAQLDNTVDILGQVFSDSSDAILVVDSEGVVLHHSRMAAQLFGLDANQRPLIPDILDWAAARAIASFQEGKWQPDRTREVALGQGESKRLIAYTITPSLVHGNTSNEDSTIATIAARDVTETHRQAARIDYLSNHDERTGALRHSAFFREMSRATRAGTPLVVFTLNLHRFKTINVTLGRDVGDQVLRQTVNRLKQHRAGFGHVLRLDGDSFALFLTDVPSLAAAHETAQSIVACVTEPFALRDSRAQVGVRVGYAMSKVSRAVTGPILLDRAEEALDLARASAGNRIVAYDAETAKSRIRARAIEQAMTGALARDEFHVLYQPQINLLTNRLCGVEALVRWTHPELGRVGPDEFIPIAESNGFIRDLGQWVMQRALTEGLNLPPGVSLAVNVSAIQMQTSNIVDDVSRTLAATRFPADRLWLELTESTLLTPDDEMLDAMDAIEQLGVAWALDDFGTGFSSLNYMATLPIRKLKVDRAFVSTLETDASCLAIIRSVKVMCEGLGITMLCEGIETPEQARILAQEKCSEVQGYLFGKPQTMAEVVASFPPTQVRAAGTR